MDIVIAGGIPVSKIVLGTGGRVSADGLLALLDRYYELGGRTVDVARMYDQLGVKSELVIGEWLRSRGVRQSVTVVTKGGFPRERMNRTDLEEDISRSLDALGCEPDLYLFHRDRPEVPAGELVGIADGFVRAGYARAWGVSNWDNPRIEQAVAFAKENGCALPALSQIQWSLAATTGARAGDDTLVCMNDARRAAYGRSGMPVMAFASQAKGFFSKFASGEPFNEKIKARFLDEANLARAGRVKQLSCELGVSAAAVALGYVICNRVAACAVVGCSSIAQLEDTMAAQSLSLTPEQVAWLYGEEAL